MFIYADGTIEKTSKLYPKWVGVLSIILGILGIVLVVLGFFTAPEGAIFFILGFVFCVFCYIEIQRTFSKYEFCKEGIWRKYPLAKEELVYWKDFQQVCVCYMQFTNGKRVVIAFVRDWTKRISGTFVEANHPFNIRSIMILDYSRELYEKVKVYYPNEIENLTDFDFNKNN